MKTYKFFTYLILILLIPVTIYAADAKVSALSAPGGGVAGEDKVYIVDDPSGTPASTVDTITNIFNWFLGQNNAFTGNNTHAGTETFSAVVISTKSQLVEAEGSAGATLSVDLDDGNVHSLTVTEDLTITITNPPSSGTEGYVRLYITAGGDYTVTVTNGGTIPNLGDGPDVIDLYTIDGGTTWLNGIANVLGGGWS